MFKALTSSVICSAILILTGCKTTTTIGAYKPHKEIDNTVLKTPTGPTTGPSSVIELDKPKDGFLPETESLFKGDILGKKVSHPFENKLIYFAYDSTVIGTAYESTVKSLSVYLKSNPAYVLKISGHCDERGSEEYNRSLGERRAISVKEALTAQGIAPERITTVSYGENKPAVQGSDNNSYAKNRRADFEVFDPS